jgi:hypothetical protein
MAAQPNAPAPTAWGRCLGCNAEGHLDTRTGLCATCQAQMPHTAAHPTAPPVPPGRPGQPPAQPAQPYAYPYQYPAPQQSPYAGAYPAPYPGTYPNQYQNPYPYAYPYTYPYAYPYNYYSNPYAWSYPYPVKPPQQQSAETRATLGAVLCLIGLTIVFPFGFITAPMAAVGLILCYSSYREGVHWALWGMVFALAVLVAGVIGVVALFTIPPIW